MHNLRERAHTSVARLGVKVARRHRLLRIIREEEAASLSEILGLRVLFGPCKGLSLLPDASWGRSDLPLKVLGMYEQPVHAFIERACPVDSVVCIGAADGYYGIGLVVAGHAERAVCFELTEAGREVLAATASHNDVSGRIAIMGKADPANLLAGLEAHPAGTRLVIVDIEGGEFDLLTPEVLAALSSAHVLVELHPRNVAGGMRRQRDLLERASPHFDAAIVRDQGRTYPAIPQIADLSDDQRSIIVSEGRQAQMEWLLLTPRAA